MIAPTIQVKAGFDNFFISIEDPGKGLNGVVNFKYKCKYEDKYHPPQNPYSLTAKPSAEYPTQWVGERKNNLICPKITEGDGHWIHGVEVEVITNTGTTVSTTDDFPRDTYQYFNWWVTCNLDATNLENPTLTCKYSEDGI